VNCPAGRYPPPSFAYSSISLRVIIAGVVLANVLVAGGSGGSGGSGREGEYPVSLPPSPVFGAYAVSSPPLESVSEDQYP